MVLKRCLTCGAEFNAAGSHLNCSPECSRVQRAQYLARWSAKPENKRRKQAREKRNRARPEARERARERGKAYYRRHRAQRLEYQRRYAQENRRQQIDRRAYFARICARLKCRKD